MGPLAHPRILGGIPLWVVLGMGVLPLAHGSQAGGKSLDDADLWNPEKVPWVNSARQFFVAPDPGPGGDGTKERPWELDAVLKGAHAVPPGSVVWVRGGVYYGGFESVVSGTAERPVILRAFPGELPRIDAGKLERGKPLTVSKGSHVWFWGLEVTDSNPARLRRQHGSTGGTISGIGSHTPDIRFINLLIHDVSNTASTGAAVGNHWYGCLTWCCGGDDNLCHSYYPQNRDASRPQVYEECLDCNSGAVGLHMYSGNVGPLDGFQIIGCVTFNSGASKIGPGPRKQNILIGGKQPGRGILVKESFSWAHDPGGRNWEFGYSTDSNEDITLLGNVVVGQLWFRKRWQSITMKGNTLYAELTGANAGDFPGNTVLGSRPKENWVLVRPNMYEPGRAHIIVYNWQDLEVVFADVSKVLKKGDPFEVRNGQNFLSKPLLSGVYDGKPLPLFMASGFDPAQPLSAPGAIEKPEMTGKQFNVFVLLRPKP